MCRKGKLCGPASVPDFVTRGSKRHTASIDYVFTMRYSAGWMSLLSILLIMGLFGKYLGIHFVDLSVNPWLVNVDFFRTYKTKLDQSFQHCPLCQNSFRVLLRMSVVLQNVLRIDLYVKSEEKNHPLLKALFLKHDVWQCVYILVLKELQVTISLYVWYLYTPSL